MARTKASPSSNLLSHYVSTRVDDPTYKRINSFIGKSDCHSRAEVARRILSKQPITVFHHDRSIDLVMDQLSGFHRELNAIGVNINQITRSFHGTDNPASKTFHATKVAEQYRLVGAKVDDLLAIISALSLKWLQK